MSAPAILRATAIGAAAALVVVGAYALGHEHSAAASPRTDVLQGLPVADSASSSGVNVSGTGRVSGTPNILRMQLSISVTKPDANAALQAANVAAAAVQKTLQSDGVAAADLQTSGLSVQQNYDNGGHPNGYAVNESMSVVLRDNLTKAGATITDVAQAGGDAVRIDGASLDIADDAALLAQARTKAFADAKAKAQAYATASGRTLGAVTSINEADNSAPQPYANFSMEAASAAASGAPVPIQAGSQDVTVSVTATWALS